MHSTTCSVVALSHFLVARTGCSSELAAKPQQGHLRRATLDD